MSSQTTFTEDLTAKARIREAALQLFAARGFDATTVRQIAAAAHVSPALVIRHFGSKPALREAVDAHVLATFEAMLTELTGDQTSLAEAMIKHLPAASPLSGYLRRMLLDGSVAGHRLFQSLFTAGRHALDGLIAADLAAPGSDPAVRAAFLTANDLAVFLLREPLTRTLGFDPLSPEGLPSWSTEVLAIYSTGIGGKS